MAEYPNGILLVSALAHRAGGCRFLKGTLLCVWPCDFIEVGEPDIIGGDPTRPCFPSHTGGGGAPEGTWMGRNGREYSALMRDLYHFGSLRRSDWLPVGEDPRGNEQLGRAHAPWGITKPLPRPPICHHQAITTQPLAITKP